MRISGINYRRLYGLLNGRRGERERDAYTDDSATEKRREDGRRLRRLQCRRFRLEVSHRMGTQVDYSVPRMVDDLILG